MEIYHVLNRGVEKRAVVIDDADRFRFVHSLFVFNDSHPLNENHNRRDTHLEAASRDTLVDIHAWCLMPNHYHLLLSPKDDDLKNLSRFMKKLNMGYARYFNERHDRSGYLWQGKYKKVLIERDEHFTYIPYYIHLNPLDLSMPEWREGGIKDFVRATEELQAYRWSSHLDHIGTKNFPSVISPGFLKNTHSPTSVYVKNISKIISSPELAHASIQIEK